MRRCKGHCLFTQRSPAQWLGQFAARDSGAGASAVNEYRCQSETKAPHLHETRRYKLLINRTESSSSCQMPTKWDNRTHVRIKWQKYVHAMPFLSWEWFLSSIGKRAVSSIFNIKKWRGRFLINFFVGDCYKKSSTTIRTHTYQFPDVFDKFLISRFGSYNSNKRRRENL